MKKFLALVKLLFVQQYRSKPVGDKKRKASTIVLIVVLGLLLLPVVIGAIVGSYTLGTFVGADTGVTAVLILVCQGVVLVFGTLSVVANVFNNKDADRLLFLPMRTTTIFLAKMTVVYINEVLTTAAIILIALLPFGIGAGAAAGYFLMLPLALLLIPVLPLFVGTLLAMPFAALFTKFKDNGTLRTIFQIALFVIIIVVYMSLVMKLSVTVPDTEDGDIEAVISAAVEALRSTTQSMQYLHPNFMLATAMTLTTFASWWLAFLTTLVENAALLGIITLASLPFYRWILFASLETASSKHKTVKAADFKVENKGVLKELVFTDMKRVLRNGQIGFQSVLGLVMMPILIVVFSFAFNQELDGVRLLDVVAVEPLYQAIAPLVIVAYMSMLGIGCNMLGIYPITRENKSLYLLKSYPVSFDRILLAKVVLATATMVIGDFLTCLLAVILFKVHWYYGILMLIVMCLLGFGGMCITTLFDLKSPKLGWTNFNQSLKNAKNSWIAMLIGLIASVVVAIVAILFILWFLVASTSASQSAALAVMWIVIVGIAGAFAVVCYKIMASKASAYFEKIEA